MTETVITHDIPFHLYDTYIVLRTVVCSFHQRSLILPISGCRQQEIAKHTYSSQKYHAFVTRFNARTCGSITCESSSALPHLFSKSRAVRRHLLAATCKIQKGSRRLFPIAIISPIKYSFDKQNQRGGYKFWLEQSLKANDPLPTDISKSLIDFNNLLVELLGREADVLASLLD